MKQRFFRLLIPIDLEPANIEFYDYGSIAKTPRRKDEDSTGTNELTVDFGDLANPSSDATNVTFDLTFNALRTAAAGPHTVAIKIGTLDVSPVPQISIEANVNILLTK